MNYPLSAGGAQKQHRTETYPETLLSFIKMFYFSLHPLFSPFLHQEPHQAVRFVAGISFHRTELSYELRRG